MFFQSNDFLHDSLRYFDPDFDNKIDQFVTLGQVPYIAIVTSKLDGAITWIDYLLGKPYETP